MDDSGIAGFREASAGGARLTTRKIALRSAGAAVAWIDRQIGLAAVLDAVVAVAVAGRALVRATSEDARGRTRHRAAVSGAG